MPETIVFDAADRSAAERFLARKGRLVGKRRLGRGGRDFKVIDGPGDLPEDAPGPYGLLLQEWIESRVGPYALSLRSVAFGGRHVCLYANLALRPHSNHGVLAYVEAGDGRVSRLSRRSRPGRSTRGPGRPGSGSATTSRPTSVTTSTRRRSPRRRSSSRPASWRPSRTSPCGSSGSTKASISPPCPAPSSNRAGRRGGRPEGPQNSCP